MGSIFIIAYVMLLALTVPTEALSAPVIISALAPTLVAGTLSYAIASLAINMAISYVVNKMFAPDPPQAPGMPPDPGVKQRLPSDPSNKLPVVYGESRVRGQITHAAISSNNQKMFYIIPLSEGPVESIGGIQWNDNQLTMTGSGITKNFTQALTPGVLYDVQSTASNHGDDASVTDFLTGNMRVRVYPEGGRCSEMEANDSNWLSNAANRTMPDVAYVYVELTYDREAGVTGLANDLSFRVNGRKVKAIQRAGSGTLADPYTYSLASTETYNTNPAACMVDYLTNETYGGRLDDSLLKLGSFYDWQEFCDETPTHNTASSTTAVRYTMNGAVNTNDKIDQILSDMTIGGSANLTYTLGQFGVIIDRAETIGPDTFVFTQDNIYGEVNVKNTGFNDITNELTLRYDSKEHFYQEEQVIIKLVDEAPSLMNPNEPVLERTMGLPFTNNEIEATRIARILLKKSRETQVVQFSTDLAACNVEAGDVVSFFFEPYGIGTEADPKEYRIISMEETQVQNNDKNGASYEAPGYKITAQEYNADVYTDEDISEFTPAPNTTLPNPRNVGTPQSVAASVPTGGATAAVPYFEVTWSQNAGTFVEAFEVFAQSSSVPLEIPQISSATLIGTVVPGGVSLFDTSSVESHTLTVTDYAPANHVYVWVRPTNRYFKGAPGFDYGVLQTPGQLPSSTNKYLGLEWQPAGAESAYSMTLSNEAHTVSADADGSNPVFTGSGTTVRVFRGSTELTPITSGTPSTDEFIVASSVTNVTAGASSIVSSVLTFADLTAISADQGSIEFTATIGTATGTFDLVKTQSITRTKTGAAGAAGTIGITPLQSNQAALVPSDNDGTNEDFTNTQNVINLIAGSDNFTYRGESSSYPTETTGFNFTLEVVATNVTQPTSTGSGTTSASFADITAMSADTGLVTYTVRPKNDTTELASFNLVQTFTKAKAGASAGAGSRDPQYFTYEHVTATPNTVPASIGLFFPNTTFITNDVVVINAVTTAGGSIERQHVYVVDASGASPVFNVQSNFIDGNLLVSDTVTADAVNANAITAEALEISNNAAGGTGMFFDGTNNKIEIYDSGTLRVVIGNLA